MPITSSAASTNILSISAGIVHSLDGGLREYCDPPVLVISVRDDSRVPAIVGPTARVQLVLFARQRLDASDARIGLLSAAAGAGVLLGSLAMGRLTHRWPLGGARWVR